MEQKIDQMFDEHDKNKNEFLEREEARDLLSKVSQVMSDQGKKFKMDDKMLDKLLSIADTNKDGKISR